MINSENNPYSSASSDSGLGGVENQKQTEQTRAIDDDDFELPDNWPEFDFHRKKSCLLSRIFSTCVTKAINHLELVQNAIERKEEETKTGRTKRQISFSKTLPLTNPLEIVGRGGQLVDQHPHHDILEDEILEEVLLLLARLDRERLRLINLCENENRVRDRLKENIDHWRLKRLVDLPLAVQKEHDACITDITELQWHIAYNARLAEKVLSKIDLSRTWHRQLEIEVNDIRQTIPLITEKVQTELTEITRVDEALKETEHELMLSRAKNADTLDKCTKANQRAGTERDEIRGEIDKALKSLQRIAGKLQASIDQHKAYEKAIRDAKSTVKKNDRAYEEEVKKRDVARADIASNKLKLATIGNERERLQHDIERLNTEFDQARLEEKLREDHRKQELDALQAIATKREEKLDKILKKEREKATVIDEDERKLEKIEIQIDRDKKSLTRFDQQRGRDAEMLRTVTENLQRAFYTNDSISTDMKRETEKLQKEEDGMRTTMEAVRRQIHEESNIIAMLDKHLDTDNRELDSLNQAETIRAEEAERVATDLQSKFNTLTVNVTTLETADVQTKESLGSIKHNLLEINETYVKEKDQLSNAKISMTDQHETASTTANELDTSLSHILTQTAYMRKHLIEMDESRAMMETLTTKIRGEIQTAEVDLAHENYNFGLVEVGEQEVVKVLQECLQRQSNADSLNKQLYKERSNYLSDKKVAIAKALLHNKELASSYRKTLYAYYGMKTCLMGKLEQRLDAVARVKDTRQLIELQERLHSALSLYFGIKNEYVEQQLDNLNRESHQNGLQLFQVQETIQLSVDHITKFLVEKVDFKAIHEEAMLKVHREELQQQQQQKVPV
ncbi:unnamed protein product [Rotaria magnacalcarata]|uniref:Coiled-coil domain-containing protein 178 n=7 Tax=Rotaria magnacalcarata TaxID=392030 RepID=A0A816LPL5_9BILA|nr:unnamed protein product [Rotaria magnacalcarata]CAF1936473.1 unnamed protein product [Rotaria magnacalcarata]CAF2066854.1 unnamed protein product [Rotaria magnacalcarata]CAF3889974.1 unnamed protein product [Rotaria magnacalcarata]